METVSVALQVLFAIPVIAGTAFALIGIGPVWLFMRRTPLPLAAGRCGPTALLKPVCGLEKRLEELEENSDTQGKKKSKKDKKSKAPKHERFVGPLS